MTFAFSSAFASAAETVDIIYPTDNSVTGSDITLNAVSSINAVCEYMVDGGGWSAMSVTGGTSHSQPISGLSSGNHNAHVHCCTNLNAGGGCGQALIDNVRWNINPAIPEFPSPLIPVLLSLASFGIVSFRIKKGYNLITVK